MLTLPAYAKINLTLEVLGSRDDGYHEIASVFQTIDLADTLSFEQGDEVALECNIPDLVWPQNSAFRAAKLLRQETGYEGGALIHLHKAIPIGAGLGGHSADEAAVLRGLNELWSLGLDSPRLLELASRLSSDTSFLLYGGTALVLGRGERITPLPPLPQTWLVLLTPRLEPVADKTSRLYASLTPAHFTSGWRTEEFAERIRQGHPLDHSLLFNAFEAVAFDLFPDLSQHRSRLLEAGAAMVHLAGSGPTLFTIVPDRASGEAIMSRLSGRGHRAYLVHTVTPELKE